MTNNFEFQSAEPNPDQYKAEVIERTHVKFAQIRQNTERLYELTQQRISEKGRENAPEARTLKEYFANLSNDIDNCEKLALKDFEENFNIETIKATEKELEKYIQHFENENDMIQADLNDPIDGPNNEKTDPQAKTFAQQYIESSGGEFYFKIEPRIVELQSRFEKLPEAVKKALTARFDTVILRQLKQYLFLARQIATSPKEISDAEDRVTTIVSGWEEILNSIPSH